MAEEIRFPIVGEDRGATRVLKDVARESGATAAATRALAAEQSKQGKAAFDAAEFSRVLADSYDKGGRAAAAAVAATKALGDADKALAREADYASAATVAQTMEIDRLKRKEEEAALATRELGSSSKSAAGKDGLGLLTGSANLTTTGLGALIGVGAALSPVLVTLGTGFGGLGLAALAAGKNSKQLKAELTPLKAQFAEFGKSVQPTLVSDFAAAAKLAGHVLKDIQPVTIATGKALHGLFGEFDQMFASGEWQSFFGFMAKTAGPDLQMVGKLFIDLANDLPPLLVALQPVASVLLKTADAIALTGRAAEQLSGGPLTAMENFGKTSQQSIKDSATGVSGFNQVLDILIGPKSTHSVDNFFHSLHDGFNILTGAEKGAEPPVRHITNDFADQAKKLNTLAASYENALTPLENYIGAQITEKNDLVTLNQDLKKSHDMIGLKTAAERQSFGDTQTFIKQTIDTGNAALAAHNGIQKQIDVIKNALPVLENVKGKTAAYRQELQLLKGILDKLRQERRIREDVVVTGTGTWHEAMFHSGVGHAVGPAGAAGAFIRQGTTATADDVIARVSKGELIVPSKMVAAGLVDHLRGAIPGFASGGIIPSYHGSPAGLPPWTSHNQAATVAAITAGIAKSFASAFMSMSGFGTAGPGGGAPAANAALARRMMPAWGSGAEWAAWNYVGMRESGWSQFARNPSSGAYGIPQALPPGKMGPAANPPQSNPAAQISWMIGYIRSRYGDPIGAAAHERSFNWYRRGFHGVVSSPTVFGAGEAGPERVDVTPVGRSSGGTVNINVHVSADASMHPAETGRVIAEKLKAHVRRGGSLYPAGMTPR